MFFSGGTFSATLYTIVRQHAFSGIGRRITYIKEKAGDTHGANYHIKQVIHTALITFSQRSIYAAQKVHCRTPAVVNPFASTEMNAALYCVPVGYYNYSG